MKYVDTLVTFTEVPEEISLCINISNCPCHCKGCHSAYLADDIGKPLTWDSLNALIHINYGISCVCFMGGDATPEKVNHLAMKTKQLGLKTCWYSGKQELDPNIQLKNFDYIKLGPYVEEFGPLDSATTNQKFYQVDKQNEQCSLKDITYKFQKF